MTSRLLILGAGPDQVPAIRAARALGVATLAVDRDPDATGATEADAFAPVSSRDVPALLQLVRSEAGAGRPLHGSIAMGTDIPDVVAALAQTCGWEGPSTSTAHWTTHKLAMKRRLHEQGVPIPWFAPVYSAAEVRRHLVERGGRLVLKPVDRSGSRGVFLLRATDDIEAALEEARTESFCGETMVEEFLDGPQISTESLHWDGRLAMPGFADRNYEHLARYAPRIIEDGGIVPSREPPRVQDDVQNLIRHAAEALGIVRGVAKGVVVLHQGRPMLIEMAARLSGGDFAASLIPRGNGVDLVTQAVRAALGLEPEWSSLQPRWNRCVLNRYLFPTPGTVQAVEGLAEARRLPGVVKAEVWVAPGDAVGPLRSHVDRLGVIVVEGSDLQEATQRLACARASVRVVME